MRFRKDRKAARAEMDMTSGPLLPKILSFSGPLILTGILQLLYNAADVIVVGNFAGHEALAAVSSTGSLINLLVNVFMGLSVGASVVVARNYGARDIIAMRKAEHTAITVALFMGIGVGVFGFLAARPLLQMMESPEDVIDGAALYVRIYFLGMPANMLYNFGAAILRAVGDTKRPLYYLMISGLDRPMSITESDFNAFCEVVKKEDRDAKVLSQEISRLTVAIRNLYELLRARMR